MSKEMLGIIGIIVLYIFLAARMWIGVAMTLVGFLGVLIIRGGTQAFMVIGQTPFTTLNNYSLTVVPMFVLMGLIISASGMGSGLFGFANAFLGHRRGGLASASVVAAGLLGAITGSHMAGTIIMSKVALPEMRKYHYDDKLSCGAIAGGAPLSIIIPPSMPMIMYGILTEESVGKLFIGGIVPGIILVIIYIFTIKIITKRDANSGPAGPKTTAKEKLASLRGVWPMLLLFVLVLGGIYGGWFTVTESGAIGALGAIIISFAFRTINFKKLMKCFVDTALLTGTIFLMMIGTYVFISFITFSNFPFMLSNFVEQLHVPNGVVILAMACIYIILGMFMPDNPMTVLTVPILYPIAVTALGMNGIWFGLFVVFMTALGSITPPVGMVVYLLSGLTKIPVDKIFKGVMPFIIAMVIVIVLICVFPSLVTWLPGLM